MGSLIDRIERTLGFPNLTDTLATQLAPTDLQSILLETLRRRVERITPANVLSQYESNRFVHPSPVAPTSFLLWEQIAYSSLPQGFQAVVLSPVTPLGTCAAVAGVDQNWAVSTVRNTEVVSDSTNVLSLECALRRRHLLAGNPKSPEAVHLAASHRLLRAQQFSGPKQVAHFASFALCSAGRDLGNRRFEISAVAIHVGFYLAALRSYLPKVTPLRVTVGDLSPEPDYDAIEREILRALRSDLPDVDFTLDPERVSGRGYYIDLVFKIHASSPSGGWMELVDGGCVDWTRRMLGNAKERLLISGIGSERLCTTFPAPDAA